MDCKLFLLERDDFCGRMYGLRFGKIDPLRAIMEKSLEKTGLAKPFLVTPSGLTHKIIQEAFRKKIWVDYVFPKELDDLSEITHERWSTQSYFIRHGGHQEANEGDKKLKLFSAKKIWEKKIATMTSLEVSQFSFEYALANGASIDVKSVSVASGSRYTTGLVGDFVPTVHRFSDRVNICLYPSDYAPDHLRSRVAEVS